MDVSREHIEIVEGARGPKARIAGHNIRVEDVVGWHEQQGMSAAEIVEHFPTITHAAVYAALAYYWDHKEELDRHWAEQEAWVKAFLDEHERNNPSKFQEAKKRLEAKWRLEAEQKREAPARWLTCAFNSTSIWAVLWPVVFDGLAWMSSLQQRPDCWV